MKLVGYILLAAIAGGMFTALALAVVICSPLIGLGVLFYKLGERIVAGARPRKVARPANDAPRILKALQTLEHDYGQREVK